MCNPQNGSGGAVNLCRPRITTPTLFCDIFVPSLFVVVLVEFEIILMTDGGTRWNEMRHCLELVVCLILQVQKMLTSLQTLLVLLVVVIFSLFYSSRESPFLPCTSVIPHTPPAAQHAHGTIKYRRTYINMGGARPPVYVRIATLQVLCNGCKTGLPRCAAPS